MRTQKINSDSSGYASSHELPVTRELPVFLSAFAKANRIPFCIWWKEKGRFCRSWDVFVVSNAHGVLEGEALLMLPSQSVWLEDSSGSHSLSILSIPTFLGPTQAVSVHKQPPLPIFSVLPSPSLSSPLFPHQAKMSHFPSAHTSRLAVMCDKGG